MLISANHDAAGMKVIIKGFAFAEEFGAKDDVVDAILLANAIGVAHRNGAFDDHQHIGVDL